MSAMSSIPDSSSSVEINRKPVKVVCIRPVYTKDHLILNDVCQICQKHIDERCNQCTLVEAPHCPITIGKCNHGFHGHCLIVWLKNNKKCPVDMQEWNVRK